MGYGLIDTQNLINIADAIREKNGSSDTYKPNEMATAISNIPSGGSITVQPGVLLPDAELVKTVSYDKYINADEGINIPSYTTTTTTLLANSTYSDSYSSVDIDTYDYFVTQVGLTIPEYNIDTVGKGRQEYTLNVGNYEFFQIRSGEISGLTNPSLKNTQNISAWATQAQTMLLYYQSATNIIQVTSNYGCYQVFKVPQRLSNNIILFSPQFTIRGSSTYFTQTYMDAITDIRFQYVQRIYRLKRDTYNTEGWYNKSLLLKGVSDVESPTHTLT